MLTPILVSAVLTASITALPTPTDVVRHGNDQVQQLLANKNATAEQLAARADDFVDFVELARRALGKEWNNLTPKQREEFSTTMKQLLRASYAQKAIGQSNARISYGKEKVSANEAEVPTTLEIGKGKFPVIYRLYRLDADAPWKIYDVVTDEVSLMETYRDQFRKVIAQKGYAGLLETLKRKRDELEAKGKDLLAAPKKE